MKISMFGIAVICAVCTLSVSAQKFGHINSADLVSAHPGVTAANAELEKYKVELATPFEAKLKAFQSKYQFFVQEMEAGTLSRITAQTREEELRKEQEALSTEEQQMQFALLQRREQLLQPIIIAVDSVIQLVGKEGSYTMIFDSSQGGSVLFGMESNDLTEKVRARIK